MKTNCTAVFILLLITTTLAFHSQGQNKYSDFGYQDGGVIFYETFQANINGYPTGSDNKYEKAFEDGYYKIKSKQDDYFPEASFNKNNNFKIDQERDFQIEAEIKYVSGIDNNANALLFGKATEKSASGFTSQFRFGFSGNGKITIDNYNADSRSFTDILGWTPSQALNRNDFNKLTIRKTGNKMYYFVNQTLVHTSDKIKFYGQNLGVMPNSGSEIHLKNLIAGYITKKKNEQIENLESVRTSLNNQAVQYRGYQPTDVIFSEDFSSNNQNWKEGSFESSYFKVENGYYVIQSFKSGYYAASKFNEEEQFKIDQSRNFQIECKMKFISGEDNNSNSLNWGQKANDWSNHRFGFSGDGSFKIYSYDSEAENKWINYQTWTNSSAINEDDYNRMTIRKVDNLYYFFINEVLVSTVPYKSPFGNVLSIQSNQNTTIRIDDILISYIETSEQPLK